MAEPILVLEEYSEKSFVIRGGPADPEATKNYKDTLVEKKGMFNSRLKEKGDPNNRFAGYIFSKNREVEMQQFVDDVNMGLIEPVIPAEPDRSTQYVNWKVVRPYVGQSVTLSYQNQSFKYVVTSIVDTGKYVSSFQAKPCDDSTNDNVATAFICDGQWSFYGLLEKHQLTFKIKAPAQTTPHIPIKPSLDQLFNPVKIASQPNLSTTLTQSAQSVPNLTHNKPAMYSLSSGNSTTAPQPSKLT